MKSVSSDLPYHDFYPEEEDAYREGFTDKEVKQGYSQAPMDSTVGDTRTMVHRRAYKKERASDRLG